MNEPRPWSQQEPPAQVQRLLAVGLWEQPAAVLLEQTVSRARAIATAQVGHGPAPVGQGHTSRALVKYAVVGVVLMGVITVLAPRLMSNRADTGDGSGVRSGSTESAIRTRAAAQDIPPAPAGDKAVMAPVAVSALAPVGIDAPEETSTAKPTLERQQSAAPVAGSFNGRLCKPVVSEQIELLERVKSEIRVGNGAGALGLLDRYDGFGKGRCFVLESLKYRMDAAQQMGNRAEARRVAGIIKAQYPDTAQGRQAAALLEQ